jgi:hypothetical protein
MMGDFRQFTFADFGPGEARTVLEVLEPYVNLSINRFGDDRIEMDVSMRCMSEAYVTHQWLAGIVTLCQTAHVAREAKWENVRNRKQSCTFVGTWNCTVTAQPCAQ